MHALVVNSHYCNLGLTVSTALLHHFLLLMQFYFFYHNLLFCIAIFSYCGTGKEGSNFIAE